MKSSFLVSAALVVASLFASLAPAQEFLSTTIDLGVCVTDIEKSAKFYTEVVGMKELPGFEVPGEFAGDIGLSANKALKIRVFALGEGEKATKIKLVQVPGVTTKKSDNEFVHSQTGFRYLTIMVADQNAALERIKKAGVKPVGKTPVAIPADIAPGMWITILRDPDGNLVELVGPKK